MFFRKSRKIKELQLELKERQSEINVMKEDIETWSRRWDEQGKRLIAALAEAERLKKELITFRNQMTHIALCIDGVSHKANEFVNTMNTRNKL